MKTNKRILATAAATAIAALALISGASTSQPASLTTFHVPGATASLQPFKAQKSVAVQEIQPSILKKSTVPTS